MRIAPGPGVASAASTRSRLSGCASYFRQPVSVQRTDSVQRTEADANRVAASLCTCWRGESVSDSRSPDVPGEGGVTAVVVAAAVVVVAAALAARGSACPSNL